MTELNRTKVLFFITRTERTGQSFAQATLTDNTEDLPQML
ncbi:MAG: hypothetical protein ACI9SY_000631 [Candidatus Paceibacteria bacterium]|jgi:hypothetical protein